MGDLEKRDSERPNGDKAAAAGEEEIVRVKNRVAELDRKIIEESVDGLEGSAAQLPLAAAAVSVAFAAVVIVYYFRAYLRSIKCILRALTHFKESTGLSINLSKSQMVMVGVSQLEKKEVMECARIPEGEKAMKAVETATTRKNTKRNATAAE
ncbi:unnamed protein product [Cuscuta campestris]|uniref:Uncharacterized protein n=1 Tax=Cuscuta campestris TaxID=132261 RepID=A0A484LR08_9ASTE|nr:unnamed protein product [Cuscuta campestris]